MNKKGRAAVDCYTILPQESAWFGQPAHFSETGKFLSLQQCQCEGEVRLLLAMHIRRRGAPSLEPDWKAGALHLPGGTVVTVDQDDGRPSL